MRLSVIAGCSRALLAGATLALPGVAAAAPVPARPTLSNPSELTNEVHAAIADSRLVIDGTVFADLVLDPQGAHAVAYYGRAMGDPGAAEFVRRLTAALRFTLPAPDLSAESTRHVAVFWMFQSNGCEPRIYEAPQGAFAIRVCASLADGKLDLGALSVRFEPDVELLTLQQAKPEFRGVCNYPVSMRERGVQGSTMVLVHIDASGALDSATVIESSGSAQLDAASCECFRRARYRTADGGQAPSGYARYSWTWQLDGHPAVRHARWPD